MYNGVCCAIPSLFSDEGDETLAETLITRKTLVVVVNVWSENLFPSLNIFETEIGFSPKFHCNNIGAQKLQICSHTIVLAARVPKRTRHFATCF